jgi:hypothetical protein
MQLAVVAIASALGLVSIALFSALRVSLDVRAVGEPSGAWALAFGVELGMFQLAGVLGPAGATGLEARLFGRKLSLDRRLRRKKPAPTSPDLAAKPARPSRLPAWLDPLDALGFLLDERRHFAIEALDVDLDYGFRDVALTGKIAGVLYALAGALPPPVRINQRPSWEGGEAWQIHVNGRVALWPGLVLAEVLWYMLRARLRYRSAAPEPASAPGTAA